MQYYMNIILQLTSLNFPLMMETALRPSMGAIMEFAPIITELNDAKAAGDYYRQGEATGKMTKYFLDGTIAN